MAQSYTEFASPARAPRDLIAKQVRQVDSCQFLHQLYDAVSEFIFIVNENRQIVFCNRSFLEFAGRSNDQIYGQRPGEAVGCRHALKNPAGCGTTNHCSACGAINAVLLAQTGKVTQQQCTITRETDLDDLELQIRTSPLDLNGSKFVICAASDISHEKRRRILERVFFHDVLNTAAAIRLQTGSNFQGPAAEKALSAVHTAAIQLIEEIKAQRDLLVAESGELATTPIPIKPRPLLQAICDDYVRNLQPDRPAIALDPAAEDFEIVADHTILSRIIRNMVKNALEASKSGHTVTLSCTARNSFANISIHNPSHIPEPHQLKIFQRSFSTKGPGRGLGTYSIKLLTERYLNGRVRFTSTAENGTTFTIELPITD